MMKKFVGVVGLLVAAVAVLLAVGVPAAAAADCEASRLQPCLDAFVNPKAQPTKDCCDEAKEEPAECLCQYLRLPGIDAASARRVADACGMTFPSCQLTGNNIRPSPISARLKRQASPVSAGLNGEASPVSAGLNGQASPVSGRLNGQASPLSAGLNGEVSPVSAGLNGQASPVSGRLNGQASPVSPHLN